jgi:poly-gamma-glutamate synthesis protein (capsule biosynthesis protein)
MATDPKIEGIVLLGTGDVGPIHEPMGQYPELVRPTFAEAHIRFGQCERLYSDRGTLQIHSNGHHSRLAPSMASIFTDCGFDVVSLASNHAMDWGEDALMDTRELMQELGIQTAGAGANLDEARQPAIVERDGVKVAFLARCSVLRDGYAAEAKKVGVAPLRAHTYYEAQEYQAGTPPRVVTVPYAEDLEMLREDIRKARQQAHVVVISLHWGIHFIPRVIAEYQPLVAHAAFEAGADLILGHHAHVPKGIEVYQGKACFYSLSNFMMSSSGTSKAMLDRYGIELDPEYPHLPYGAAAKRSLIARAVLSTEGVKRVSFLPVLIDKQLRPEVLHQGDARFDDAVSYMDWASEGLAHRFDVQGDEVVLTGS